MNTKYKYKSSNIATFAFATFCPFIMIIFFALAKLPIGSVVVFILWLISLPWVNNVKIHDDKIEVYRFFRKNVYKLDAQ